MTMAAGRSFGVRVSLFTREDKVRSRSEDTAWVDVGSEREIEQAASAARCEMRIPANGVHFARCGSKVVLLFGNAAFDGQRAQAAPRLGAAISHEPISALRRLSGPFIALYVDAERAGIVFATDRAATRSPCYRIDANHFVAGLTAQDVAGMCASPVLISAQAIYDYLYSHVIPAPETIFAGTARLLPGECVKIDRGRATLASYWTPRYEPVEREPKFVSAKREFRDLLRQAVEAQVDESPLGTFLSGGTDSSTVAGMLGVVSGAPPSTYSIGFDVEGYDEIGYARIAASHFGTRHHEHYLTPDDVLDAVPKLAASFDQPFGNSSVIATYFCATIARADGIAKLLGGDGGDELFGGNTRYARQKLFEAYQAFPGWATRLAESFLRIDGIRRAPPLRKMQSYVEQARIPMPARMHTYNLIDRIGQERIFEGEFLAAIDPGGPTRQQAAYYGQCSDPSIVNRMLHYDWKFTLSDNDLPKVVGACDLAGVDVGFPFLDERMVEFANRLPAGWKVRRLTLRHFFKQALRDFLPREIIAKKKHGFGMPFGPWMLSHSELRNMATGSLESLRDRAIVRRDFFDQLVSKVIHEHAGFYGELVWVMMMLEQWFASHFPAYRFNGARALEHST